MLLLIGWLFLGIAISGVGFIAWELTRRRRQIAAGDTAKSEAERILDDAKTRSELLTKEAELKAKDLMVETRAAAERELLAAMRSYSFMQIRPCQRHLLPI